MNRIKRKGVLVYLFILLIHKTTLFATPVSKVFLVLSSTNGNVDTLHAGDSWSGALEAPLQVEFVAKISNTEADIMVFPEWNIIRSYNDGNQIRTENYLNRKDLNSFYIFSDYGSYSVEFAYSYRPAGSNDINQGDAISSTSFSIDVSELFVPNAFSPNGDGINDYFKVKVKSIVSFKISIFNRWGQLIKSGDHTNLEYQSDIDGGYYICWDGKVNGKYVNDGVYFINIEAIGSGGKKYSRKSDINVLKGLATGL